jgi:hypothetical protein
VFLKIILTCGLYPQIAISDEFNNYRRDSDQIFHSKVRKICIITKNLKFLSSLNATNGLLFVLVTLSRISSERPNRFTCFRGFYVGQKGNIRG